MSHQEECFNLAEFYNRCKTSKVESNFLLQCISNKRNIRNQAKENTLEYT